MSQLTERASTTFAEIAARLPRVTEEGGKSESIALDLLAAELVPVVGTSSAAAVLTGAICSLLQAAALVDRQELDSGRIKFVSFPAYLFAKSWMRSLASGDVAMIEAGFWDESELRLGQQRALLGRLEAARSRIDPAPIRRVVVAWALVVIDGRFLLVAREGRHLPSRSTAGEFVPVGGRVAPIDLGRIDPFDFFDPEKALPPDLLVREVLAACLRREITEELGIAGHDVLSMEPLGLPLAMLGMDGTGGVVGKTDYQIYPFRIGLSMKGKSDLLRSLSSNPHIYAWFTWDELIAGRNERGQTAFVDALRLGAPKELTGENGRLTIGQTMALDMEIELPSDGAGIISAGLSGRERRIATSLGKEDVILLAYLLAVRRGDASLDPPGQDASVPELGWLSPSSEDGKARLADLASRTKSILSSPLVDESAGFFRLNVTSPKNVYYPPKLFKFTISDENRGKMYRVRVTRDAFTCDLGAVQSAHVEFNVSPALGSALYGLSIGQPAEAQERLDTVIRLHRTEVRPHIEGLGLRFLVRQVDGVPELSIRPA